jgi:hypothetical protein
MHDLDPPRRAGQDWLRLAALTTMPEVSLPRGLGRVRSEAAPYRRRSCCDRSDPTRAHAHVEAGGIGVGVDHEAGHAQRPSAVDGVRQQRRADSAADHHRVDEQIRQLCHRRLAGQLVVPQQSVAALGDHGVHARQSKLNNLSPTDDEIMHLTRNEAFA